MSRFTSWRASDDHFGNTLYFLCGVLPRDGCPFSEVFLDCSGSLGDIQRGQKADSVTVRGTILTPRWDGSFRNVDLKLRLIRDESRD